MDLFSDVLPEAQQVRIERSFSGPLPPPDALDHYERILPGAAERILRMAEIEGEERRANVAKLVSTETKVEKRGQLMAFAVAVLGLVGSFFLIKWGFEVIGTAFGGAIILGMVTLFIKGRSAEAAAGEPPGHKEGARRKKKR